MHSLMVKPVKILLVAALVMLALFASTPARAQDVCGTAPPPRLSAGQSARVTYADGVGNNLRTAPSAGATILGVMGEGEVFTVIGGPQCAENFNWWQVRRWDGQTGWTAEGTAGDYWLEPWPSEQSATRLSSDPPVFAGNAIAYVGAAIPGAVAVPYVLVPGTATTLQIGPVASADGVLVWSPDGTRIAMSDGNDIYVLRADGTQAANVTNSPAAFDSGPTWSPDGTRLAFASDTGGDSEIVTLSLTTNAVMNLSNNPGIDTWPAWSPDGTRVAFVSDRDGALDLYMTSAAGGMIPQRLTTGLTLDGPPRWSPDGRQIAFAARIDASRTDLTIVQADGSATAPVATGPGNRHDLAWSPDGKRLAFAAEIAPGTGREAVMTVRPDGNDPLQLTTATGRITGLSWSPDNAWIVFASDMNGTFDLFAIHPNGTNLTPVATSTALNTTNPAWQPVVAPGLSLPVTGTATPAPNPATTDVLLIYDAGVPVFTLLNASGRPLNLLSLTLTGNGVAAPASIWSEYSFTPLDNFKPGGCLMIWGFGIPDQPPPPECGDARQAWITNNQYLFWTGDNFTVSYNGVTVATCSSAAGQCAVDLP